MKSTLRPPADDHEPQTETDRDPARRVIGLQISMFWTVVVIAVVAIVLILYFAL